MSKHSKGIHLFRRRRHDDLLERSFVPCAGCGRSVYVFAEQCRSCGDAVQVRAS
ncbi:hypothetical protein [Kutzneria buriramensis]|jgi:hypothetical protein|uniref:Uncharacterized protein n=1 Tax=Kutzneria buriramensis TaxID=1045776 RepID=A0A3E0HC16_9PSEU|nr:hypothetical protein [Kutzneria buriramensis]REH41986.1 hypothetical protein BCF44_111291 [Kutzneria buriramensis]